jgi:hypothetical protein
MKDKWESYAYGAIVDLAAAFLAKSNDDALLHLNEAIDKLHAARVLLHALRREAAQ